MFVKSFSRFRQALKIYLLKINYLNLSIHNVINVVNLRTLFRLRNVVCTVGVIGGTNSSLQCNARDTRVLRVTLSIPNSACCADQLNRSAILREDWTRNAPFTPGSARGVIGFGAHMRRERIPPGLPRASDDPQSMRVCVVCCIGSENPW